MDTLTEIHERDKRIAKVVFLAVSGSFAWGLESPTSDHDYRAIYLEKPDRYLECLLTGNLSKTVEWISGENDFACYELGFALNKILDGVSNFVELLYTPYCSYDDNLEELFKTIRQLPVDRYKMFHHYQGWVMGNYQRYIVNEHDRSEKRYCHIIKGALCADAIASGRILRFPVSYQKLLDACEIANAAEKLEIEELFRRKKGGQPNRDTVRNPFLDNYIWRISLLPRPQELSKEENRLRNEQVESIKVMFVEYMKAYIGGNQ